MRNLQQTSLNPPMAKGRRGDATNETFRAKSESDISDIAFLICGYPLYGLA